MLTPETKKLIEIEKQIINSETEEAFNAIVDFRKNKSLSEKEKIECSLLEGRIYILEDKAEEAIVLFDEIREMSNEKRFLLQKIDSLILKAQILSHFKQKDNDLLESNTLLKKAERLLSRRFLIKKSLKLQRMIAIKYRLIDNKYSIPNWENIIKLGKELLNIKSNKRNKLSKIYFASTYSIMGTAYCNLGELKKAEKHYTESIKIYKEIDSIQGSIHASNGIGIIQKRKGNFEKAIEIFRLNKELAESRNIDRLKYLSIANMSEIYYYQGDYKKSTNEYERCLKYYRRSKEFQNQAYILYQIVLCYFEDKQLKKGNGYLEELRELSKIHRKDNKITLYKNMAEVFELICENKKQEKIPDIKNILDEIIENKTKANVTRRALITKDFLVLENYNENKKSSLKEHNNIITELERLLAMEKSFYLEMYILYLNAYHAYICYKDELAFDILNKIGIEINERGIKAKLWDDIFSLKDKIESERKLPKDEKQQFPERGIEIIVSKSEEGEFIQIEKPEMAISSDENVFATNAVHLLTEFVQASQFKILILGSDPINLPKLNQDNEIKTIRKKFVNNPNFILPFPELAVSKEDLIEIFTYNKPNILHYIGHGAPDLGLYLKNKDTNKKEKLDSVTLAMLFKLVEENLQCVFLNACYTDEIAADIKNHTDCIIGMTDTLDDYVAIAFADGFYTGIKNGLNVKKATEAGKTSIWINLKKKYSKEVGGLEELKKEIDKVKCLRGRKNPEKVYFKNLLVK